MRRAGRLAVALLPLAQPFAAAAEPVAPVKADAMRFAPPLGESLSWRVTTRRLGRDGSLIGFSSVYRLQWSRIGRGYRLDATLLRIESDARPELVQALTAVLQPLIGQSVAYLVAADGGRVELADPNSLGARITERTEALAADASRPEARAIAALLQGLSPAQRAELATADIRALVAPANPDLAAPSAADGRLRTVTKVERGDIAGGQAVEIDWLWQVDTASGLVVREQQQSWTTEAGAGARTLVEERVRALLER